MIIGPPGNMRHFTNSLNIEETYSVSMLPPILAYHVIVELIDEINDEPVNFKFTKFRVIRGQISRSLRRDQKIVRSFKFILWYKFFAHEKPFAFSSSESLPIMLKGIITHLSSHLYREYSSVIGQFPRQGL